MNEPTYLYGRRIDATDLNQTSQTHAVGECWSSSRSVQRRIQTKPGLLSKPWRWVRCIWLRWQITCTEDYLQSCMDDGILDSLSLRDFRRQLGEMRVRLAILEGSL